MIKEKKYTIVNDKVIFETTNLNLFKFFSIMKNSFKNISKIIFNKKYTFRI